jgi:hypothetical protein
MRSLNDRRGEVSKINGWTISHEVREELMLELSRTPNRRRFSPLVNKSGGGVDLG